jgi:hypothetical protein
MIAPLAVKLLACEKWLFLHKFVVKLIIDVFGRAGSGHLVYFRLVGGALRLRFFLYAIGKIPA